MSQEKKGKRGRGRGFSPARARRLARMKTGKLFFFFFRLFPVDSFFFS